MYNMEEESAHTHTNICFIDTLFVEIENVSSDGLKILFEPFVSEVFTSFYFIFVLFFIFVHGSEELVCDLYEC